MEPKHTIRTSHPQGRTVLHAVFIFINPEHSIDRVFQGSCARAGGFLYFVMSEVTSNNTR